MNFLIIIYQLLLIASRINKNEKKIKEAPEAGKSQRALLKIVKALKGVFQEQVQNLSLDVAISLLLFKL